MALSKEFYLDEIRSKYPNSYNESLKDLPVKDLEDMLDFLEGALGKADGGSIGIEVLFGPKRDEFSIGGKAKKNQPYDARASIMDYATALDKVSGGTQAQKAQSLTDYGKNFLAGLDTSKLNPATRSLAASYGVGQPISKFEDLGPGVGQALQGAIMRTLQDPRSEGISLKNIPVSSYTSYFGDRGAANTAGLYDTGYNSILDQARDMTAALAGDPSAIARTTAGRFNVDIDPEARTGLIRDRYDFSKQMPGSTPYDINIALPQKFVDEILNSPEYQKITGYKPPQTRTPLSEKDFYSQFYGMPYQGFENKYFKTLQKGDPYYDEVRRSSSAGSFSDLVDRGIVQAYTGPTDYQSYLKTFADGGRVGMVSGGFLKSIGKGIMELLESGANKKMFRSADDIPPMTISKAEGPMTIEMMEAVDPSIVKKLLRTQELGLYEETPEILKAANLLERFTKKVKGKRVIDYERAEAILGVPLKGDETINDLFKIEFETRPVEKMADGGRVGLFMGGPALEGQALDIYNSMNAYGFSDQEIADALSARGLYTAAGSETTTTAPEGIIGAQINQGGGRDDNQTGFGKFGNLDPTTERTFIKDVYSVDMAAPGAPMTGSFKPTEVTGYKNVNTGAYQTLEGKNINHAGINFKPAFAMVLDALGFGEKNLTDLPYKPGQIAGTFTGKKLSDFNPLNLFKKQQATVAEINAMNKKAVDDLRAKQAAEEAAKRRELENRIISGGANISGGGGGNITTSAGTFAPGDYSDVAGTLADPREKMDYYRDGGLATMFTRRR